MDEFLDPPADEREESGAAPGAGAFRYELRVNCRNTPRVAGLAGACGNVLPGYKRVRRPDDEIEPEIRWYADETSSSRCSATSSPSCAGTASPARASPSSARTATRPAPPPGSPSSPGATA